MFSIQNKQRKISIWNGKTYSPRRANSIDFMAVVFKVPVVTRNEATNSRSSMVKTRIWKKQRNNQNPTKRCGSK